MLTEDSLEPRLENRNGQPPGLLDLPPTLGPCLVTQAYSLGGLNLARGQTVFPSVYGEPFWELWLAYRVRRADFLKIVLPCRREHDF